MGITVVLYSFNASLMGMEASRDSIRASMLLDEKVEEFQQSGIAPGQNGQFLPPFSDFWWEANVEPALWTDLPCLYDLVITVHNKNSGMSHSIKTCMIIK